MFFEFGGEGFVLLSVDVVSGYVDVGDVGYWFVILDEVIVDYDDFEVFFFGVVYDLRFEVDVGCVDDKIVGVGDGDVVDGGYGFFIVLYVEFYDFEIVLGGGFGGVFLFVLELRFFGLFYEEVDFDFVGRGGWFG